MKSWSNIEVSPHDPEIVQINDLEKRLGKLPETVEQIRELITRFEVCHFKYQHHLKKIKKSILNLNPDTDPSLIGTNHIGKGKDAWKNDKTGRSKTGQQYIRAIQKWMGEDTPTENHACYDPQLEEKIEKWLGNESTDKTRLVRLLVARLIWDWTSYEELQKGGQYKELEQQIIRMDICHYAFPENLDSVLQAVGEMKPLKSFEGCGSYNAAIQAHVKKELSSLRTILQMMIDKGQSDRDELIRAWLLTCLIKTIKEQTGLKKPLIE